MKTVSVISIFIIVLSLAGCQSVPNTKHNLLQEQSQPSKKADDSKPREIYATNISFDAATGKIKYTLPEPALVQIRIGIKDGGPLLRNLLDWQARGAGENIENWDGKDSTGQIDYAQRKDLMMVLMCIPSDSQSATRPSFKGFKGSPKFYITFPDSKAKNSQDIPIISDAAAIRIRLDENDKTWLSESKYELSIYVDHAFLMEDEEGTNPFTYRLDTKMINNGVHSITVNLAVYDGEIGTQSTLVEIKN